MDALLLYFRQFGKTHIYYMRDNCFFIYYKEPFMVERVLSTPHYFKGKALTVERYIPEEISGKLVLRFLFLSVLIFHIFN